MNHSALFREVNLARPTGPSDPNWNNPLWPLVCDLAQALDDVRTDAASLLDEYERQTKLLPHQHEIKERGCCSYNWRMAIIGDLRRILSAPEARVTPSPRAVGDVDNNGGQS